MGVNRDEPVEFNLLRIWNKEKEKYYMFATDLNIPEEDVKDFVELFLENFLVFQISNEYRVFM